MELTRESLRDMIFYDYKSNLTSKESHERLMKALGDKAPSIRTVLNWFNEFKFGKTNLEDEPLSGRPPTGVTQEKNELKKEEKKTCNELAGRDQESYLILILFSHSFAEIASSAAEATASGPSADSGEAMDTLPATQQHLEPKKKIPQRCFFLKRTQRENETVSEYLRELKHLASNCAFGEMLEVMLRDRLVAGSTSESLQKRLLQEDDEVKLERVFALAVSYELAEKDAKELHEREVARVTSHIERSRNSKCSPTKENFTTATKERTCYRCGMKNSHLAPACPHKFKTCCKCKRIGHLSRVCKARGNTQKSGCVQQQNIFSLRGGTEVEIALTVDGKILNGIVDTGSPVTLMPKSIFEKLWRAKPLIPTAINLRSFRNNPIKVVGERKVFVKEANMSLRLIVVDESIPEILLGREWLKFLNINYNELGCLKDVKLDISIKKEEAPVFCKARSLPYSLKKKVEDELECMVERGILEPIVHASWAAPIVPVVKKDGSIRICGDFRSTANKAIILDKYPLPTIDEIFSRLSGSTIFSTLDLSMAYLQVELTDEAKRVVNINTTKGLFAYRRLPYGVAVAPNKFQRLMDNVFADIPGVACYIDNILVSGKDARDTSPNWS
ncbi:K02A2.6-like [Cordylochernes scorpioides]|uniref:K02A2.6-like n=1 Tax=Cordylochernes scorpioides TaxID=51811 RepID=A0ABY6LX35_9ARAC|nr:K02A2.6-like [Cordylochernes scorpioides]